MRPCSFKHAHYRDGHCAESECPTYYGRCPRHAPSGRREEKCSIPRWSVLQGDDTRRGFWYLHDDQRWDDRYIAAGLEKEELEYAASLLNEDYLDDEGLDLTDFEALIFEMIARTRCRICERDFFQPQLDDSGRCTDCIP